MSQAAPSRQDALEAWSGQGLDDYAPVVTHLPSVLEESIVQIGRGEFKADAAIVANHEVTIYRSRIIPKSVGITVLKPDYIGFAVPVFWRDGCRINGKPLRPSTMFLPDEGRYCHVAGNERLTLGVILRRDQFVSAVAALQGIELGEVSLGGDTIELPPQAYRRLQRQLEEILRVGNPAGLDDHPRARNDFANFQTQAFGMMADAFLWAGLGSEKAAGGAQCPSRIVRRAEERFAEAQGAPVSLADLCAAAAVSKTVLYDAFHRVCGVPPLHYFHKRRLMRARSFLIREHPAPGAVKQAALTTGLTELGRFSRDYRLLFGELPSVTLTTRKG